MKISATVLAGFLAAGCGGIRMSSEVRDPASGAKLDYTRNDPDAGGPAAPLYGCQEKREGRLTFSLCPSPERVVAGSPSRLVLSVGERKSGKADPVPGAALTTEFRHRGQRVPVDLVHPAPVAGPAREISPGRFEVPVAFPVDGKWDVFFRAALPDGRVVRTGFVVTVEKGDIGKKP